MEALDRVIAIFDILLRNGNLEACDCLMHEFADDNDLVIILAILTLTAFDKEKFQHRQKLVDRVKELAPERSKRLLTGLE